MVIVLQIGIFSIIKPGFVTIPVRVGQLLVITNVPKKTGKLTVIDNV